MLVFGPADGGPDYSRVDPPDEHGVVRRTSLSGGSTAYYEETDGFLCLHRDSHGRGPPCLLPATHYHVVTNEVCRISEPLCEGHRRPPSPAGEGVVEMSEDEHLVWEVMES